MTNSNISLIITIVMVILSAVFLIGVVDAFRQSATWKKHGHKI